MNGTPLAIQTDNDARAPVGYTLNSDAEGQRVLEALQSTFPSSRERVSEDHIVYLDTFDWRLFNKDMALSLRALNGSSVLSLETNDDSVHARLSRPDTPSFAGDLPDGRIHDRVAPVVDVRRLLPLAEIETCTSGLRILDDQEKTVVRVHLVRARAAIPDADDGPQTLDLKLQVVPVRGYPAALGRVRHFLEHDLGLTRTARGAFHETLEVIGYEPGSSSSKPDLRLDPAMNAGEAIVFICRALLDAMQANEDGVRRDLDPEFLHDFRVAGRRTRSALSLIGEVFEPQTRDHFRREFKWLGSITGPVRDLDVHLLHMDDYCASLPEASRNDLDPLGQYLRRHRSAARRRLTTALKSKRYEALVNAWREHLDGSHSETLVDRIARKPILDVASKRIWRAFRRVEKRANAIKPETPADALHKLRIDCKKLRYLLEFFHSLYDPDDIVPLIKALKRLQENLGDFNDLVVQEVALYRIAREMEQEGLATVDCLLAMGRLLGSHVRQQRKERQRFAKCYARFHEKTNRERFRRLFNSATSDRS